MYPVTVHFTHRRDTKTPGHVRDSKVPLGPVSPLARGVSSVRRSVDAIVVNRSFGGPLV